MSKETTGLRQGPILMMFRRVIRVFYVGEIVFVKSRGQFAIILDPQEQIMAVEQSSLAPYDAHDILALDDPRFAASASFAKNGLQSQNMGHLATAFAILRDLNRKT